MKSITACAIGLVTLCWISVSEAAPVPAQPVHTNQTRFRIPYRYDATEMQKLGAREVRLLVSLDRGQRWQHAQTVAPQTGRFDFEAAGEGEYWFAVRTVDANNRLHPFTETIDPELMVIVDTTPPTFEVDLRQVEPGKVQLAWNASDPHLNPEELRLEYLQTGETNWQKVSVLPQANGKTSWSVPQGGFVAVRGSVSDRASNVGRAQAQARIAPAGQATPAPQPQFPEPGQPVAAGGEGEELIPEQLAAGLQGPHTVPVPDLQEKPSLDRGEAAAGFGMAEAEEQGAEASATNQFATNRSEASPKLVSGRDALTVETAPVQRSARTRMVNTRKFQIGYQVEDVGPSGVSSVDLYITEDDGQQWFKYGEDPNCQSPFEVEVPRDGVYGFALRVRSGAGLAADPPRSGEKPPIVVTVDQTPPTAELTPPQQGRGTSLDKILIQWNVSDDYPADKPILLSYASDRHGPWEPISGWLENTGSYVWTVGPGVPSKFYIRLTARDAAGNFTRVETSEPLVVDLSKPSARIVDVEAVGPDTSRR